MLRIGYGDIRDSYRKLSPAYRFAHAGYEAYRYEAYRSGSPLLI
jgi:hypothetical protein